MRINVRAQNPHDNNGSDADCHVDGHKHVLHVREERLAPDVPHHAEGRQSDREEPSLPCRFAVVLVLDRNQGLDDVAAEVEPGTVSGLPAQRREPPAEVRQRLLVLSGRELGDPMILTCRVKHRQPPRELRRFLPTIRTSCGGSHGRHVGKRGRDEGIANQSPDVTPEKAAATTVDESLIVGQEDPLPGAHDDSSEADQGHLPEHSSHLLLLSHTCIMGVPSAHMSTGGEEGSSVDCCIRCICILSSPSLPNWSAISLVGESVSYATWLTVFSNSMPGEGSAAKKEWNR